MYTTPPKYLNCCIGMVKNGEIWEECVQREDCEESHSLVMLGEKLEHKVRKP